MPLRLFFACLLAACSGPASTVDGGMDGSARDSGAPTDGGPGVDSSRPADSGPPGSWSPPRGIPAPDFGIDDDGADCPTRSVRTQSNLDGLSDLPAGSVVEITGTHTADRLEIGGTGTAECPIIVRGPAPDALTVILGQADIRGSYVIVENLDFDLGSSSDGMDIEGDHIAFRHSDVHGYRPGRFSTVVFVGDSSDIVLYDLHIWDNGDFSTPGELDVHGVGSARTNRMWLVDSRVHENRGDSIQLGHQADNTLGDFYIGRNVMFGNGENSVDIKEASNVVISENDVYSPPGGTPAIVLHDCPINAAVISNTIHDADVGVNTASLESNCDDSLPVSIFVLDNTFTNIGDTAVQSWGSGKRYYVTGNTFMSVGTDVDIDPSEPGSIISSASEMLSEAYSAFQAIYGIDLSAP